MKVAVLKGPLLNYWVGRALGWRQHAGSPRYLKEMLSYPEFKHMRTCDVNRLGDWVSGNDMTGVRSHGMIAFFEPSMDWAQAGPIITRGRIELSPENDGGWQARIYDEDGELVAFQQAHDPMVAAMRCYVASKYGEEVPDEGV